MKLGIPSLVMINACNSPIAVVTATAPRMHAHHGQPGSSGRWSKVIVTPPTAATKATDRSIDTTSPSAINKMNTMPIASAAIGAICSKRLVKLRAVRN